MSLSECLSVSDGMLVGKLLQFYIISLLFAPCKPRTIGIRHSDAAEETIPVHQPARQTYFEILKCQSCVVFRKNIIKF